MLKYFILGLFTKIITGLDDTITHIPILASLTKKRFGRILFSIGTLFAIIFAILVSLFFSILIKQIPFYRYISIVLLLVLAGLIYFGVFIEKPRKKAEYKLRQKKISREKGIKLFVIGFFASVATVLDDIVVYSSLFVKDFSVDVYIIIGILVATILEIIIVIYFSKKISKLKYKKEIASLGLIVLAFLILFGII